MRCIKDQTDRTNLAARTHGTRPTIYFSISVIIITIVVVIVIIIVVVIIISIIIMIIIIVIFIVVVVIIVVVIIIIIKSATIRTTLPTMLQQRPADPLPDIMMMTPSLISSIE